MTNIPFLKELAQKIHTDHKENMGEVILIFPNRRAGLFFRKYLAEYLDEPVWSPNIMSMEDFVGQYADLQVADKFTLIIDMYNAYRKQITKDEGFEKFYYWGEMLLKDFDDIDKYLINPKHLFTNVSRQKELDDTFDFLTPEQQEIILSFWSKFEFNPSKDCKLEVSSTLRSCPMYPRLNRPHKLSKPTLPEIPKFPVIVSIF